MNDDEFKIIEGLIRNLSHEIKNPLTTIKGYAQLLASRPDDANLLVKSRQSILDQIERIDIMLTMLYNIFSLHADTDSMFDAAEAAAETIRLAKKNGFAKIECAEIEKPWVIKGDPGLFHRMILLLVCGFDWENNPAEMVEIETQTGGSRSRMEFIFRGIDITDLNESLFYLPYSSKKYYKNGTELYEVYTIAHLHGWKFSMLKREKLSGFYIEF